MCITIDDLPVVNYGVQDQTVLGNIVKKQVAALSAYQIPAIGFVNANKLYVNEQLDPFRVSLLNMWLDHDLELGNHTYSHPDYNKVTLSDFTSDLVKGEYPLKELLVNKGRKLRYFRHPYLHLGNTKAKYDSLNDFLALHEYITAPITIDNEDYLFALAYHRAHQKGDTSLMNRIGRDYLDYMEKKVNYYEEQSQKLFGRNISQILLIHASELNGDYLPQLISLYQSKGYSFISIEQSLLDTAYSTPITAHGNWGISWIHLWALSQGKKREFFGSEPETPAYIQELTK